MAEAELKLSGFLGRETFSQQHSRGSGGVLDHAATRAPVYWRVAARLSGSLLGIEIGMVILIVAILLGLMVLFNWMSLV